MKKALFFLLLCALLVIGSLSAQAILKGMKINLPAGAPPSDLVKIGSDVVVPANNEVLNATAVGGSVTVGGKVVKDVVAVGGSVDLLDQAEVGGDVVAIGGTVKKAPNVVIKGSVTELALPPFVSGKLIAGLALGGAVIFSLISLACYLILVAVLVALFTPQIGLISARIEQAPVRSFFWGVLAPFIFVLFTIVLVISLIGILLVPVWVIIFGSACLLGYVAVSQLVGKKVLSAVKVRGKSMMFETITGTILLFLITLVPILGMIVKCALALAGLGAVAVTTFGYQRNNDCCCK